MARHPELDHRLDVLAAPGYGDPARAHLTVADWFAVVLFLAVICGGVLAWAL